MNWEITKWEEGRLKGSIASYHVEPNNDGSRASIYAKFAGPFIMRIVMVFMKARMTKGIKGDLKRLKDLMEK